MIVGLRQHLLTVVLLLCWLLLLLWPTYRDTKRQASCSLHFQLLHFDKLNMVPATDSSAAAAAVVITACSQGYHKAGKLLTALDNLNLVPSH
jgi:hypothetical protein